MQDSAVCHFRASLQDRSDGVGSAQGFDRYAIVDNHLRLGGYGDFFVDSRRNQQRSGNFMEKRETTDAGEDDCRACIRNDHVASGCLTSASALAQVSDAHADGWHVVSTHQLEMFPNVRDGRGFRVPKGVSVVIRYFRGFRATLRTFAFSIPMRIENLTFGKSLSEARSIARELRQLEQIPGTVAAANPFVIWELIGHLGDPDDPAYDNCLNALATLSEHAWTRHEPPSGLCLVADAESTVCWELFHAVPPFAQENVETLTRLAIFVKENAPNVTDSTVVHNLGVFASEMKKKEMRWLMDLQSVLSDCNPKLAQAWVGGTNDKEVRRRLSVHFASDEFMNTWAMVGVMSHADLIGTKLNRAELEKKADVM